MCNSCGDKLWRWSCLHVSIFWGPVVHESWPLQRTLGRCQLQGLSLTGMTKSLSFSHFPLIFPSFTVKCVYINCAWSHALKITLVKNFKKKLYFHTILYQYGLVISLAVSHDFLHSFTPGLFCHSASNDFFCFISHLACFATFCILWVSLCFTPGPFLVLQTLRSCDCGAGECQAGVKYADQLEDVLRFSMPKDKCGAFFAESIQVHISF